jgi:hypothetical protein
MLNLGCFFFDDGSALAEGLHFLKYKAFPDIFGNFTLHREGKVEK